jgi:O-antigen/teichoic acid export membrane protein
MNAGSNWVSTMVMAAVGLILVPIILSSLGVSGFGVWALLARGLAYPIILERAFVLAINRFVAFYRNDIKELNRFVSASFVILTGLAVLTITAAILLSFVISDIFAAITNEFADDARITCILVGLTLACKILEANFSGALQGYQYYTRYNAVVITGNLLRAILTIGLLVVWKSMIAVQLMFLVTAFVSALLMFFVARRSIKGLKIDVRLINRKTMLELWRYTSHSVARSGSMIVMYNTMTLLVGWKGTAVDVTVYDVAFRIPGFVRGFLAGTQNVFLPAVTSFYANGEVDKIKVLIKKGTKMISALTCVSLILLFVFTEEVLAFWLKGAVPAETVRVMRVLIITIIPEGLFGVWLPVLVGMGHLRWLTIMAVTIASSAIFLELIFLLSLQSLITAPMAPAIAQIIILWLCRGFWLPGYGLYKLGISPYYYIRDSLFGPAVATLVSVAALWLFNSVVPGGSVHWLVMFAASAAVVMLTFTAISMRSEAVELLVAAKRRFESRRENCV